MNARMQHSREETLLIAALNHIGLKFWRDPKSWNVKVTDRSGKHEFNGYTEDIDWIETSSAEALGKTKTFVRNDLPTWGTSDVLNTRYVIIENPFFGVKCAEELSVRLDLLVLEEKKEDDSKRSCKNS